MTATAGDRALVTGGAGYAGALVVEELLDAGREVRVLDRMLHGQHEVATRLRDRGAEVIVGDVRDTAARARALDGVRSVVHLAAIVGDPACALDPAESQDVNVEGTRALALQAAEAGVGRLVFASTCSNYGRMADPTTPIDEDGALAPVSLYARQKVEVEQWLAQAAPVPHTCLRFATLYGAAPRMRFDLTVNEFVRDLWADRELEVFGEQFWRPYVHVRDAARAVRLVLDSPTEQVGGRVYNVGRSSENFRKVDLVELIRRRLGRGRVVFVRRDEDPRDYKVSFDRIAAELGYATAMTVETGIAEMTGALDDGRFGDPYDAAHRNIP